MTFPAPVAVVGGGIGGLAAALALGQVDRKESDVLKMAMMAMTTNIYPAIFPVISRTYAPILNMQIALTTRIGAQ